MSSTLDRLDIGMPGGLLVGSDVLPPDIAGSAPNGQPYTYSGLFHRYRSSPWGIHQAAQPPRFTGKFGYDPAEMLQDHGYAAHPVEHNVVAAHDLQMFLMSYSRQPEFRDTSPRRIVAGRLAMQFHDTGESTHEELAALCGAVVGDISHDEKTPADRACERRVLEAVFDRHLSDLPEWLTRDSLDLITHHPSVADDPIHHLSEASHDYGEFRSGLRAGLTALKAVMSGESGFRVEQLGRMGKTVVACFEPRLEQHVAALPFIEPALEVAASLRDRIAAEL